jgi:hypothetical protein
VSGARHARPRADIGTWIAVGSCALLAVSFALPWWRLSDTAGKLSWSVSGRVTADGTGWIYLVAGFTLTALALFWRSPRANVAAVATWFFALMVTLFMVTLNFPGIELFSPALPSRLQVAPAVQDRLIGARLAFLAVVILTIGVVVHGFVSSRYWTKTRSQPASESAAT